MSEVLPVAKSRCFAMQKPPRQRAKPLSRGLIRVWISAKPEEAVQNSGREPKAHRKQKSAAKPTVRRVISCRLRPRVSEKNRPPKTRPGARTRPRQKHKRQKNRKRAEPIKPKRQKKKGAGQTAAKRPGGMKTCQRQRVCKSRCISKMPWRWVVMMVCKSGCRAGQTGKRRAFSLIRTAPR